MAATLQALSFVEKWEPVQVRFTLRLRDQQSKWMQDGCKVYMDSYVTSNGSCFMVTSIIFKNHLLKVGLTHNHRFNLFYYVWGPEWIWIHWGSIWLTVHDHTTNLSLKGVLGRPLHTFLLGSHNFMVTALGSCVKWPYEASTKVLGGLLGLNCQIFLNFFWGNVTVGHIIIQCQRGSGWIEAFMAHCGC